MWFKSIKFILLISFVILLITFIFPIKFCIKTFPKNSDKEFYVVRYDCMKNWWILAGDVNELYDWNTVSDISVDIKGNDFREKISGDLYLRDMPTYFILWGHAEVQEQYDDANNILFQQYVINCTDWDILGKISSRNNFRGKFSNRYLTIYDYKWFDAFRKLFWEYEEY